MELEALKFIGVGLLAISMIGASIGIGMIFSAYFNAISRNPSTEPKIKSLLYVGAALAEAMGIFGVLIAFMILS